MQRIGEDCPQIVRAARDGADGFPLHFPRDWARNCVQAFNNGAALEARCQEKEPPVDASWVLCDLIHQVRIWRIAKHRATFVI